MASRGRHTRSTSQLPLVTLEVDPKKIIRKGKVHREGASIGEPGISGNFPSPSLETPLISSHFPTIPYAGVSRTLNFRSVPIEISPLSLGLEGEILVTLVSLEVVPWTRYRTIEHFPTSNFTTPPLITVPSTAEREASANSSSITSTQNPPFFPFPPRSSVPTSLVGTPSPPSSPPPNIPMAGANPPMTRMEAIIVARYAPLVLPQPLNALPTDGYLKQLPKFIGEGDITAE
jgi:hypothetical protein